MIYELMIYRRQLMTFLTTTTFLLKLLELL